VRLLGGQLEGVVVGRKVPLPNGAFSLSVCIPISTCVRPVSLVACFLAAESEEMGLPSPRVIRHEQVLVVCYVGFEVDPWGGGGNMGAVYVCKRETARRMEAVTEGKS
jgi:hypothetical protein